MSKLVLLVLAAGCMSASQPKPAPNGIVVDVASVALAQDCGDQPMPPPAVPQANRPAPAEGEAAPQDKVGSLSESRQESCDQTRIQLSIKAAGAAKIHIKRVELLDASGKVVGNLTPRTPSKWVNDSYQAWNEQVVAGDQVTASYALSAPKWDELGGRDPSVTYRVRVTVAVGDEERTIDKAASTTVEAPALPEPPGVVT
jgi:hypothetical protein